MGVVINDHVADCRWAIHRIAQPVGEVEQVHVLHSGGGEDGRIIGRQRRFSWHTAALGIRSRLAEALAGAQRALPVVDPRGVANREGLDAVLGEELPQVDVLVRGEVRHRTARGARRRRGDELRVETDDRFERATRPFDTPGVHRFVVVGDRSVEGERAAHLEDRDDLESAVAPDLVERREPMLGVRAADERDRAIGIGIAVHAAHDVLGVEVGDAPVPRRRGQIVSDLQRRRMVVVAAGLDVLEERPSTGELLIGQRVNLGHRRAVFRRGRPIRLHAGNESTTKYDGGERAHQDELVPRSALCPRIGGRRLVLFGSLLCGLLLSLLLGAGELRGFHRLVGDLVGLALRVLGIGVLGTAPFDIGILRRGVFVGVGGVDLRRHTVCVLVLALAGCGGNGASGGCGTGGRRTGGGLVAVDAALHPQRPLDVAFREPCQCERDENDNRARYRCGVGAVRERQVEDEQRPVDQVERVAEITETTHRIGGQKPRNRLGKPANLFAFGDHAEDDDEQRAADRVPGPPRGEMLDAFDEEATGDDHRQARDGRDRAQQPRHHDANEHDGEDTADEQLPQARPRVVVIPRLIRLETAVRVPDRHQTDRREDCGVQPLGRRFSEEPEERGDAENQG